MKPSCYPEKLGVEKGNIIYRIKMLVSVHSFNKCALIKPVVCTGNTQIKGGSVIKELPAWEGHRRVNKYKRVDSNTYNGHHSRSGACCVPGTGLKHFTSVLSN